jgi:hypothetical protein
VASAAVVLRAHPAARAQVARADALVPGQPLGRGQRVGAGQQRQFAHGHPVAAGRGGQDHRPLPAAVAGQGGLEAVRRRALVLVGDAEVRTDLTLAEVGQRLPRQPHGIGQQGAHMGKLGGRLGTHTLILPYRSKCGAGRAVMLG